MFLIVLIFFDGNVALSRSQLKLDLCAGCFVKYVKLKLLARGKVNKQRENSICIFLKNISSGN